MKRKIEMLGLGLLAALAMSSVAAGSAGAEGEAVFVADDYPAVFTVEEEGESNFTQITGPEGPELRCETAVGEGTLSGVATEITVTPHFEGCEATNTPMGDVAATIE